MQISQISVIQAQNYYMLRNIFISKQKITKHYISIHTVCTKFRSPRDASRAGRSRWGAKCKSLVRDSSEQWFCDVIVFSQPC